MLALALLLAAWAPGELLVRVGDSAQAEIVRREYGLALVEPRSVLGIERVRVPANADLDALVRRLAADPRVTLAEKNAIVTPRELANDYLFGEQWALHNVGQGQGGGWPSDVDVNAPQAWDITTGSADVVVAITDTGVWLGHEDLAANAWKNLDETAGNGVDDDGNGYVDDRSGFDFVDDDANPMDESGHGTHVAGIVGARGDNGIGISGVAWTVRLMALRMIGEGISPGTAFDAAESIVYAVDNGAHVINASWGFDEEYSEAIDDAFAYAAEREVLIVAASGNSNKDLDREGIEDYPTELDYGNVITVGAVARDAWLTDFSNYGRNAVDIGAPGGPIILSSHVTQGGWGYYKHEIGTSMAAPHVAGIAALLLSVDPTLKASDLRRILLSTARPVPDPDATLAGGRADAYRALRAAQGVDLPPIARVPAGFAAHVGNRVTLPGTQSMDPNGTPLTYQWALYKPTESAARLSDAAAAEPTFDADVCGYYEGILQVSDGANTSDIARVPVFVGFDDVANAQTPHPYWSSYEQDWTFHKEGATSIAIRFDTLDTRGDIDAAAIWRGNTLVAHYSGKASGFLSKPVFGDTLRLSFYAPSQQSRYGFLVDQVWWCDGRCDQPGFGDCDGDPANGCEQDLFASERHCGACNVPCPDPGSDDDDDDVGGGAGGGPGGGGALGCGIAARPASRFPAVVLALAALSVLARRRKHDLAHRAHVTSRAPTSED